MPEFNFANEDDAQQEPTRNNPADFPATTPGRIDDWELPEELSRPPERSARPKEASSSEPEPFFPPPDENIPVSLDEESRTENPQTADFPHLSFFEEDTVAVPQSPLSEADIPSGSYEREEKDVHSSHGSRLPIYAFLLIILILLGLSVIWFINPYPPLKRTLQGYFEGNKSQTPVKNATARKDTHAVVTPPPSRTTVKLSEWEYYLQISSWRRLPPAQAEHDKLARSGIHSVVEGEYIPARKATFYRVKLGPFANSDDPRALRDSLRGKISPLAFVDSSRILPGEKIELPPNRIFHRQPGKPAVSAERPVTKPKKTATSQGSLIGIREEPVTGYGLQVSSYRTSSSALHDAQRLLARRFPVFVTKKNLNGALWFRVFVGPFKSTHEADRYAELLSASDGNDVYTVDFSSERRRSR